MLRLDLIDPEISGNKWFKLKYNLEQARLQGINTILTFGGAFSNHIAATAATCKRFGLQSVGVIRGEESTNPTLIEAKKNGMKLHFVSREQYTRKEEVDFQAQLQMRFGDCLIIPEGGSNSEGMKGCMEILPPNLDYDYIFCACGTGATYSGLFRAKASKSKLIGISVLKGENKMPQEVERLLHSFGTGTAVKIYGNEVLQKEIIQEDCILNSYAFKGYARYEAQLVDLKKEFESIYKIPLDYVYTNKLMFGVFDLVKQKKLPSGSKLLIIHSGGLQGNKGFEELYDLRGQKSK